MVYKEHSFDRSDARFSGLDPLATIKCHNDCGCTPVPVFGREHKLPEVNRIADEVYVSSTRGVKSGEQVAAFRKAWNEYLKSTAE
jgi:hypothetical protein